MATKHTPGPWNRNIKPAKKYATIYAGRNTHVCHLSVSGLTGWIADCIIDEILAEELRNEDSL